MKFLFPFLCLLSACAVVVHPTGGDMDQTPPKAAKVYPDSNATLFSGKEIRIAFDEYVEIKDLNGILISPPPLTKPKTEIAGKTLIVKFKEPLRENTTYTLQLINALHDVNEKNVLPYYSLSFSTGTQIDTNQITGKITENYTGKAAAGYTVALFHPNVSEYPDSLIYPLYISKTDDGGNYTLSAIKDGTYTLYAFNDINSNLRFETGENFAFHPTPVSANDTIALFSAENLLPEKPVVFSPVVLNRHTFLLPLKQSESDSISLVSMTKRHDKSEILFVHLHHSDTLLVADFVKEPDNLLASYLVYNKNEVIDTVQVEYKDLPPSYPLKEETDLLFPGKSLQINAKAPIRNVLKQNMSLVVNDSIQVPFNITSDAFHVYVDFEYKELSEYQLLFLDSAIVYFDGATSPKDTFLFSTDSKNNLADLAVIFNNVSKEKYRVELLSDLESKPKFFLETNSDSVYFSQITSGEYHIRLVRVDPTSFPKRVIPFRKMPSQVFIHPVKVNLRGGWTIADFVINNPEQ